MVTKKASGLLPKATVVHKYWISSSIGTAQVNTNEDGVIIWTAPVWSRFKGQHFYDLLLWLGRQDTGQVLFRPL